MIFIFKAFSDIFCFFFYPERRRRSFTHIVIRIRKGFDVLRFITFEPPQSLLLRNGCGKTHKPIKIISDNTYANETPCQQMKTETATPTERTRASA